MSTLDFDRAFERCPLIAILRGLTPAEAPAIGGVLADEGFTLIEVPLNSPDALQSIGILAERLKGRAMIGAGTVLTVRQVDEVAKVGGEFIVSPNTDLAVIQATRSKGMNSLPGYFTASEAFAALGAGADALKLFPADGVDPAMLTAHRAVLPKETRILAVGGINVDTMERWSKAGASGFGMGSNLYKAAKDASEVATDARALVAAWRELR